MATTRQPPQVSVITTVYNEAETIEATVEALARQSLPPAEIVITDGGSTDGTAEIIEAAARNNAAIRSVRAPGGRSLGRNVAFAESTHDIVALIDGGCVPELDWLERIVGPFADGADWVAGFHRVGGDSLLAHCAGLALVPVAADVDESWFLPSARSMALTRAAWEAVGGFPEELEFAEDTQFGERLSAAGYRPVLALDAVVTWTPPSGFPALARTAYRWGKGDGLAGLRSWSYGRSAARFAAAGGIALVALLVDRRALPLAAAPLVPAVWRAERA
jgi:glycosyltransferase involved in cell wall biosynthesis